MTRSIAVWWIKRDARLADNACLFEAERLGMDVLPFFCFEPSIMEADDASDMHVHAQGQAISGLRCALRAHGSDLIVAHGEVVEKLTKLRKMFPFEILLSHEEIGNDISFRRDLAVAAWCQEQGVVYREFPQSSVQRGGIDRDRLNQQWLSRVANVTPLMTAPIRQSEELRRLASATAFPQFAGLAPNSQWQPVSESDARSTLTDFLTRRGQWYRGGISSPNTAFTAGSRLSVHLAWGTLSVRQIWHAVQDRLNDLDPNDPQSQRWRQSLGAFVHRLHWRDHFTQRLESEPELEFRSIHPSYESLIYENDESLHTAWREGRTGYPMIDAVMRCLATTGFVNFRMRAMVVSFACHVLHLDWRLIHPHLARVFRDYDPGIHLNQLQMQAGVVGWNTIRVYNPAKQLTDWDSQCQFVKRWLPELTQFSPTQIVDADELPGYVSPIVPFKERAKRMTDMLYAIRKSVEAKAATPAVFVRHGSRKKAQAFRPRKSKPKTHPQSPSLFDDLDLDSTAD